MKKIFLLIIIIHYYVYAQSNDSNRVFQLLEVVVTADSSKNDPIIEYYKINTPVTTEEILSRTQSVQMIRRGNYGLEPVIRGLSAGQISLTIDGMKIQSACTDKMDPVTIYIEPQNLQSIDVKTSEEADKFGSDIGGSINLKLAQPNFSSSLISGSAGFQSVSRSFNSNFSFNSGGKKLSALLNGVFRKSNNYRAGDGKTVPFSYYEKTNLSLSARYLTSENSEIRTNILFDDGWNIGYPALPMDVGYAKARIYSIAFLNNPGGKILDSYEGKVYANFVSHYMDDTKRPDIPMHMDMPGWSYTFGTYTDFLFKFSNNHSSEIKAEFYKTAVRAEMTMYPETGQPMFMLTLPDSYMMGLSLYLRHKWNLPDSYTISASARIENINTGITSEFGRKQLEVFGYNSEYKYNKILAGGTINVNKYFNNISVSLSGRYSERMPTFNEMFGFYLFNRFDGYDYAGSPLIKPEESMQSELTISYSRKNLEFTATGFFNRINDYITGNIDEKLSPMTIGAKGVKFFANIEYATIAGYEFVLNFTTGDLNIISSVKYSYGKDNKSEYLALIPPLKILTTARYKFNRISMQGEAEFAASQYNIRISSGEQATPEYLLFNYRISYAIPFYKYVISVNSGIENIFDIKYRDHLDWGNIFRPGSNIYVSLSFSY